MKFLPVKHRMVEFWKLRRTEPRIKLALPIVIEGEDFANAHFREEVITHDVSKGGVCISINRRLKVGSTFSVSACQGKFQTEAIVKGVWVDNRDGKIKIGIQFIGSTQNWVVT